MFAIWATLTLPLCLAVRHDGLWVPWVSVAMTAVSLWVGVDGQRLWNVSPSELTTHLSGWSVALLLTFALGPLMTRFSGAGVWALRTSLTQMLIMITSTALTALFRSDVAPQYWCGLLVLFATGASFIRQHPRDSFALSELGLGMNILLAGGLGRLLLSGEADFLWKLFLWGIGAAFLLAATVTLLLHLIRRNSSEGVCA